MPEFLEFEGILTIHTPTEYASLDSDAGDRIDLISRSILLSTLIEVIDFIEGIDHEDLTPEGVCGATLVFEDPEFERAVMIAGNDTKLAMLQKFSNGSRVKVKGCRVTIGTPSGTSIFLADPTPKERLTFATIATA